MQFEDDPTGFIAQCVSELITVGFDASAINVAKWAGLGLLAAILLATAITFFTRLRQDREILPFLSDIQFRLLLLAGVILITLPLVTKLSGEALQVTWTSADRDFAHRICQDSLDVTAGTAKASALAARIDQLETSLDELAGATLRAFSSTGEETGAMTVASPPLLGQAVSVFYNEGRNQTAERIAKALRALGAGVALRQADLAESSFADGAAAGDNHILYGEAGSESARTIQAELPEIGVGVTATHGPLNLRGSPLQIMLF